MGLVKELFESKVKNMKERACAIAKMEHRGEKGYFREYFINEVISGMFPLHIGVGSGLIVNKNEDESGQCDVIIFDKRTLPPFIANTKASVYPVESVIAVIEVKSVIGTGHLKEINKNMKKTKKVFDGLFFLFSYNMNPDGTLGADLKYLKNDKGRKHLPDFLTGYCILGSCSNFHMKEGWVFSSRTEKLYEVKRFLAVTTDNIRRVAETKYEALNFDKSREAIQLDLWSEYIREE